MVNVITEHIDVWTAAQTQKNNGGRGRGKNSNGHSSHGIKKLRELILELAVRGKLAPQDPNDEPAKVLLEKIAKEKARLIKEGKIKKQKKLPEIREDEKPFELPVGWEWLRLGGFSEIKGGKRLPKGHSFSIVETPFIYIQVTNMKGGAITRDNLKYISEETHSEISRYTISKDDLYITIAGTIGDVGVVPENFDGMNLTENAAKIVFSEINKAWLQKTLSSEVLQNQFANKTNQLAQPKLALHRIATACIALPPLAEQHRIVAKVDELMALCDQLEQQQTVSNSTHQSLVETLLATLTNAADQKESAKAWQRITNHFDTLFTTEQSVDQLKQTILQLAVMGKLVLQDPNDEPASVLLEKIDKEKARLIKEGTVKKQKKLPEIREDEKPFELPVGWEWLRLGGFSEIKGGKRLPKGHSFSLVKTPYIYVQVTNMKGGTITQDNLKYISEETHSEISRYTISKDDLYITIAGTIGDVGIVPVNFDEMNLTENAAKIIFSEVDKLWLQKTLSSEALQNQFTEKTNQLAQPKLALHRVATSCIALPPLAEQHRIVAKVDELMALCETLKARLNDAQTIQVQLAYAIVEHAVA